MTDTATVTYLDASNEKYAVVLTTVDVTAGNFNAQGTLFSDLLLAAQDISGGIVNKRRRTIATGLNGAVPTDALAQRETKWLIGYTDVTANLAAGVTNPYYGKNFTNELPTANPSAHLAPNSDYCDLTITEVAALVTAFEAVARSPSGGAVDINYIKFVGRNN